MVITALPLYHIFALTANCLSFMNHGARNILITNPRDLPAFVKELAKYKFPASPGSTAFHALLNTRLRAAGFQRAAPGVGAEWPCSAPWRALEEGDRKPLWRPTALPRLRRVRA